jgi:hypothetical protein
MLNVSRNVNIWVPLLGPAPETIIALDPTFGSFRLLEPVSHIISVSICGEIYQNSYTPST